MDALKQAAARSASPTTGSRAAYYSVCVLLFVLGAYFGGSILRDILLYGVAVPFWDEWNSVNMFQQLAAGKLSWLDIFLAHQGEHRIGVQVSWSILLWHLTGMNIRFMMVVNWALSLSFTVLVALITRKAVGPGSAMPWIVWATSSLFVFNPAAYQLWMWGLPPAYMIVPLLFLAGVHVAQWRFSTDGKLIVASIAALLASMTFSAGLVLWVLFPVALGQIVRGRDLLKRRIGVLFYGGLSLITIGLYLQASFQSQAPPVKATLHTVLSFFLAYTGNLVLGFTAAGIVTWAHVIGFALVVFFCVAGVGAVRACYGTELWSLVVIWLCLGCYGVCAGLLVSVGRQAFGVAYAVESSRYVLASSVFPVAAAALACICVSRFRLELPGRLYWFSGVLSALVAVLTVSLVIRGAQTRAIGDSFRGTHVNELRGKVAVSAANLLTIPEYRLIFPRDDWNNFRALANFITTRAGLKPGMWDDQFIQKLADARPEGLRYGYVDEVAGIGGEVRMRGWAYLDDRQKPADAVIVAEMTPTRQARIVTVIWPSDARADVMAALRAPEAVQTGWMVSMTRASFADGHPSIRCFGYDAETGHAHLLGGPTTIHENQ